MQSDTKDSYLTLASANESVLKEKGSRFLAFVWPVQNEEEIKLRLDQLGKNYPDATHHCYAYVLKKEQYRSNDDGEPKGAAGLPILNQIRSKNLNFVLLVVVRYFGGTKLGLSPLIKAYKTAALEALGQAKIIEKPWLQELLLSFGYLQMNGVMKLIKKYDALITGQEAGETCEIRILLQMKYLDPFLENLSLQKIEWKLRG